MRLFRCSIALCLAVWIAPLCDGPLFAATSEIVVNLEEGTVSPPFPAVNNWSSDGIVIRLKGVPKGIDPADLVSQFDIPCLDPNDLKNRVATYFCETEGPFVNVQFNRCNERDYAEKGSSSPSTLPCPRAVVPPKAPSWRVYSGPHTAVLTVYGTRSSTTEEGKTCNDDKPTKKAKTCNEDKPTRNAVNTEETVAGRETLISFPIRIEQKPFALAWSAGFSVTGLRDDRFQLLPTDDETVLRINEVDKSEYPYQLAAFVHYQPYRIREIGAISFGLSTDVPVEELTFMLGFSITARTFPVLNNGYLTAGLAYGQRKHLAPAYQEIVEVSSDVQLSSLSIEEYGSSAFVAVTFGFFGGRDQFTGVYPAPGTDR